MYKYLLAALAIPAGAYVYAQSEVQRASLPIVCSTTKNVISALISDYKEEPIWAGKEQDGVVVSLWVNTKDKTFTLIKTDISNKISCVISAGDEGKPEV